MIFIVLACIGLFRCADLVNIYTLAKDYVRLSMIFVAFRAGVYMGESLFLRECYKHRYLLIIVVIISILTGSLLSMVYESASPTLAVLSLFALPLSPASVIFLLAIILSVKRSAILSLALCYIVEVSYAVGQLLKNLTIEYRRILFICSAMIPILMLPLIASSSKFSIATDSNLISNFSEIFSSNSLAVQSGIDTFVSGRFSILKAAYTQLSDNSLMNFVFIGYGVGWSIEGTSLINGETFEVSSLHSSFLDVLFRFGLVFSLILMFKLISHIINYYKSKYNVHVGDRRLNIYRLLFCFTLVALSADVFVSMPIYWIILGASCSSSYTMQRV